MQRRRRKRRRRRRRKREKREEKEEQDARAFPLSFTNTRRHSYMSATEKISMRREIPNWT